MRETTWDHAMSAMSATCMRKGGEHAAVKLMFEISSGRAGSSVHERGICMDHWWPTIPHTRFLENRLSWILQNSRFLKDISISNVNIDVHNMIWTRLSIHDMLKMCTVDVLSKFFSLHPLSDVSPKAYSPPRSASTDGRLSCGVLVAEYSQRALPMNWR